MTYIALLRGINVGGRVIKMAELKHSFAQEGYTDVRTVLQTGNVVFASDIDKSLLQGEIEALLAKTFDYPAQAQIYTVAALENIINANPYAGSDQTYHQYVIFLDSDSKKRFEIDISDLDASIEAIQRGQDVMYWCVLKGMTLKSKYAKRSAKLPRGTFSTTRNINTLQKIIASTQD